MSHAQTKIQLANIESQASDLNEMLELLQMKNERLQAKLMMQTEIRSFMNSQWDMLNAQHKMRAQQKRKSKTLTPRTPRRACTAGSAAR